MLGVLAADGSAAFAHGGVSDATNYVSRVVEPGAPGLEWKVYGGDSLLQLTNHTGEQVVVEGYEKEPYLKFVPGDGIYENVHSPATYYNSDRYARVALPDDADATLPAEWRRITDGDRFAWHDHRVHWMSPVPPSPVFNDRGHDQTVFPWEIGLRVGGDDAARAATVRGVLSWEASVAWWPPVLAFSLVFLTIALLAAWRTRPHADRWPGLARPVVVILWVVAVANLVRMIDDLFVVPGYSVGRATIVAKGVIVFATVIALTLHAWRGHVTGFLALAAAGVVTFVLNGAAHSLTLSASQVLTGLPVWFARAVVAASIAVVVPVLAALVFAGRHFIGWYRAHPISFAKPVTAETPSATSDSPVAASSAQR